MANSFVVNEKRGKFNSADNHARDCKLTIRTKRDRKNEPEFSQRLSINKKKRK